ncbi:MFS transporter [Marmoricola sp. URHB0036]|uniref:MFS transporter n=1 Tax=Marmoricola sp. URHB0036 TaxID=1298863 RepID=UPI00041F245E|nr:MFS transporter [Marmoricola sp. URHB0036]
MIEPTVTEDELTRETPSVRQLPRMLTPFRIPAYRRMAVALACGAFAYGVWTVALVWEVIRLGGGPAQLSVVSTAGAIGVLLPALLAGVIADRVPQKLIVMTVASAEVVSYTVVTVLSLAGATELWHLGVVSFFLGAGMAFYYAAYSAWLPAIVPESDLMAVNGFEGMVRPLVAEAIGPGVAGVVVGIASPAWACLVAAVVATVGVVVQIRLPRTPVRRDLSTVDVHPVRGALHDMRDGISYMLRTPWLLATLLFASLMVLAVMGPLEVLIPFVVKDRLGGNAGDHAMVLASFGIGGAVGSMVMASLRMPRRYLTLMNLMWGVACLPMILMGRASAVWVVVACAFVLGALFSAPMVIWGTLLQRRVPAHLLGRVASLDFFVSVSLMPISMALAGPVSNAIGLADTFLLAGVTPLVFAVVAILWARLPQDEMAHPLD